MGLRKGIDRQTDRNCIDNKKLQLDLPVTRIYHSFLDSCLKSGLESDIIHISTRCCYNAAGTG